MKYKIVVDSSSDLTNDYLKDENIGFEVVPLTINVDGKEYVDNETLNIDEMLTAMHKSTSKATSSCPSCGYFASTYEKAENVICITMTSKLSGTYNSAYLGSNDLANKVHVVDSKATSGTMRLLVDKAYELMKQDLDFDTICEEYANIIVFGLNIFILLVLISLFILLMLLTIIIKSSKLSKVSKSKEKYLDRLEEIGKFIIPGMEQSFDINYEILKDFHHYI